MSGTGTGAERVHLIGLVSDGGVHSGLSHLEALIELGSALGVEALVVHAFTDGRDTLPESGAAHLETVDGWCARAGNARVGSVIGRYFAMDRDNRWDRIEQAYDMLVHGREPPPGCRPAAATSRWTATPAGTGSSRPTTCSSTDARRTEPPRRPRRRG